MRIIEAAVLSLVALFVVAVAIYSVSIPSIAPVNFCWLAVEEYQAMLKDETAAATNLYDGKHFDTFVELQQQALRHENLANMFARECLRQGGKQ